MVELLVRHVLLLGADNSYAGVLRLGIRCRVAGINREYHLPDAALRRDRFRNSSEQELVE
jgi:hypothetical protein